MKLKILFLFFTLTFNTFQIASGAVDIKKNQTKETIESSEKTERVFFSKNKIKRTINKKSKKRRKFKLRNLFKWKKLKKTKDNQEQAKKELDPFALLGGLCGGFAYLLILFSVLSPRLLILIVAGGVLGMIGLKRIRNKPEKRRGEFMAWMGIVGFIVLLLGGVFLFFLDAVDFL